MPSVVTSSTVISETVAVLARRRSEPVPVIRIGALEVDPASRQVKRGAMPIRLTAKEFALLEVLVRAGDQPGRADRTSMSANETPLASVAERWYSRASPSGTRLLRVR